MYNVGPDLVLNCFQRKQAAMKMTELVRKVVVKNTPYNEYVPLPIPREHCELKR